MKIHILIIALLIINIIDAQVGVAGINELNPKATLHIEAKDNINPETGAGILIPSMKVFPSVNPTADQYGMLVYRSEVTGSGFEGFYYWDAPNNTWEYIVSSKLNDIDLNKTSAYGTAFQTNILQGNTSYVKIPFSVLESPKANYTIDANGDLNIGQTGKYYLSVTGGVNKPHTGQNLAEQIQTSVFINNNESASLVSKTVFPAVFYNERSVTFAISSIITLQAGDILSLRAKRFDSSQLGTLTVNSPFTIILSYLD
ncbi:hypothetical protein ACFFU1_04450 [Algibacter miyuki]|uniref:C1q domain-containing protein n=1 Tax=Algibacter miyuki TaxID=1306933 RepID=A0ABV5GWW3_9FLAO|nr:hypothetical protein [Algibacter miyuki]MDN3664551.1 hypothetical protein [Algibacter miyuki]